MNLKQLFQPVRAFFGKLIDLKGWQIETQFIQMKPYFDTHAVIYKNHIRIHDNPLSVCLTESKSWSFFLIPKFYKAIKARSAGDLERKIYQSVRTRGRESILLHVLSVLLCSVLCYGRG